MGLVSVVCTLSTLLFGETGGCTAGLTRQGGEDKERERHVQDFLQIHAHLHAAWSRWSWWDHLVNSLTLSSFTSKTGRRPVPISLRGCELSSERFALRARLASVRGRDHSSSSGREIHSSDPNRAGGRRHGPLEGELGHVNTARGGGHICVSVIRVTVWDMCVCQCHLCDCGRHTCVSPVSSV